MNVIYKIFAFLILIAIKINENSASYIYQEINQSLASVKQINFSMFMKNLNGVVLYAVDHSDRILIELEKVNGVTEMVYTNNKHSIRRNIHSICGCSECSYIYMEWRIELAIKRLSITCEDFIQTLNISQSNTTSLSESISNYPPLRNYLNKTLIMIGNIGPFVDYTEMIYLPLKNQLVGCLHQLYVNENQILFNSNGSLFNSSCPSEYKETICGPNYCNQSIITYKINDCSISQLNRKYCATDLKQFHEREMRLIEESLIIARIDWEINPLVGFQCLLDFKMKIIYNTTCSDIQKLKSLDGNSIETMILKFLDKDIIIQLSSGEDVQTHIQAIASEPTSIRVGYSSKLKECKFFKGRMNFQEKRKKKINFLFSAALLRIKNLQRQLIIVTIIFTIGLFLLLTYFYLKMLKQIFHKIIKMNYRIFAKRKSGGKNLENIGETHQNLFFRQLQNEPVYYVISDQESNYHCL